jgi:predicted DNA-binding ribbon-helix-helix protein
MEPEEYERLEEIAERRGVPVAELIRTAVRERYLLTRAERRQLIEGIFKLDLPVTSWEETEAEIIAARTDGLP